MGTKYSTNSASGYNSVPPSDDGTVSEANKVKWSTIKTKLADPIKDLADTINSELATHFDTGPAALTTNTTLGASHYNQFVQVSGSGVTLTLTDASTLAAGWYCIIRVTGTATVTLARATGGDTINGTAANLTLNPGDNFIIFVNAAANGFFTIGLAGGLTIGLAGGLTLGAGSSIVFEGATDDGFETTVSVTDPTADRTITIPDYTGTVSIADPVVGLAKTYKSIPNATNPNYQIDITADSIVVENSSGVAIKISTWSATLDLTASGANGLDTGAEAANTFYYVWAIYDGTNKKFLFSTSTSSPTLPSGYTFKALVDVRRNDGSSNLISQYTNGKKCFYTGRQQVLSGGTAATETSVTITSFVPAIAETFQVDAHGSNGAGLARNLQINLVSGTLFQRITIGASTATDGECSFLCPNINQQLYYQFSGASCTGNIWIQGYSIP